MSLYSVVANMLDYNLEVKQFELLLQYYFHFRSNIFEKGMTLLTTPAMS